VATDLLDLRLGPEVDQHLVDLGYLTDLLLVAQRPGSGFTANRNSGFSEIPAPNLFSNGSTYY